MHVQSRAALIENVVRVLPAVISSSTLAKTPIVNNIA